MICPALLVPITTQIDARRNGRSKGSSEQQGVKNQLAELRGKFQALLVSGFNKKGQEDLRASHGCCRCHEFTRTCLCGAELV